MSENDAKAAPQRRKLTLVALAIAGTISTTVNLISWVAGPWPSSPGWMISGLVSMAAIAAIPFLLLAFLQVGSRAAWTVGVVLTIGLWSLPILDMVYRRGEGGANIGLGMLILISPIAISVVCLFVARKELYRS